MFSPHVSLVFSGSWWFLSLSVFLFLITLTVLSSTGHIFYGICLNLCLSDVFLWIQLGLIFRRINSFPYHIISGSGGYTRLTMFYHWCCLALVAWPQSCLLSFSTVKLMFSPFLYFIIWKQVTKYSSWSRDAGAGIISTSQRWVSTKIILSSSVRWLF